MDHTVYWKVRGGPFDTWGGGGYGFSFRIKLFSTPSLNVQFFTDLVTSKQFFSQRLNSKQFFSPFISFDSLSCLYTMLSSRGVTTFT